MGCRNLPRNSADYRFEAVELADGQALAELRVAAMHESLERVGRFEPTRARERFLAGFDPAATRQILYPGLGGAVLGEVLAEDDAAGMTMRVTALRKSDSNRFYLRHGFTLERTSEYHNWYVRPANAAR